MNTDDTQKQVTGQEYWDFKTGLHPSFDKWISMTPCERDQWERHAQIFNMAHSQRQSKAAEGAQAVLLTQQDFADSLNSLAYLAAYTFQWSKQMVENLNAAIRKRADAAPALSTPAEPEVQWLEYEPGETVVMEGDETLVAKDRWALHQQPVGQVNRFTVRRPVPAADSGEKPSKTIISLCAELESALLAETARANKAEADFSEIKMAGARAIAAEKARADRAEKERDQWKEWHESIRVGGQLQAKRIQELESRLSQQRGALTMSDLEEAQEAVGWDAKGMADFLNKRIYVTRGVLTAEQVESAFKVWFPHNEFLRTTISGFTKELQAHLLPLESCQERIPRRGRLTREVLIAAFFTSFPNGLPAGVTVPTEAWDEVVNYLNGLIYEPSVEDQG